MQVRKEIQLGTTSIFWMSFPTVALFFWEVRGHSRLYDSVSESSLGEMFKNAGHVHFNHLKVEVMKK